MIMVVLETRVSGERVDRVIQSLGFQHSHRIEANGFRGVFRLYGRGVLLCKSWRSLVNLFIFRFVLIKKFIFMLLLCMPARATRSVKVYGIN